MLKQLFKIAIVSTLCVSMLPTGAFAGQEAQGAPEVQGTTTRESLQAGQTEQGGEAGADRASSSGIMLLDSASAASDEVQYSSIPWLAQTQTDNAQTDPSDVTFTLTLSSTPAEGTTYKVYTTEDRSAEAGTVTPADDGGTELTLVLNEAPTRDTRYFLTATQPDKQESAATSFVINTYRIAKHLSFSYGEFADIPYTDFYQDETTYEVVLPTGTPADAPISLAVETADGATVAYGGDTNLSGGEGTATATVTAAEGTDLSYTYAVHFTTMSLGGSGTQDDPYLIMSADELAQLAACLNSGGAAPIDAENAGVGNFYGHYFKLTCDLDLSGVAWEPIGHSGSTYFAGNFDGNGHTVCNMTCAGKPSKECVDYSGYYDYNTYATGGLFGWVAFGSVTNLTIRNADVSAVGHGAMSYAGGLVACAYSCDIGNCAVYDSSVSSSREPNNSNFAGGVVGIAATPSTFERCASDSNSVATACYGGGFIGSLDYGDSRFTDCYVANCTVTGSSNTASIFTLCGAFLGASQEGTAVLDSCHVFDCTLGAGEDTRAANVVGLFTATAESERNNDVDATDCYYYSEDASISANCSEATPKTKEEFASAEMIDLLGEAFAQGPDGYPVLNVALEEVTLSSSTLSLAKGETAQLTMLAHPGNAIVESVVWESGNTAVATVDESGVVTAIGAGTATITVTVNGGTTATCTVTVEADTPTPPETPDQPVGPVTPSSPAFPPDISDPDNGIVTVSPVNPREGDEVTITPLPDEGKMVDDVSVVDSDGNPVEVVDNGDGTFGFTQPDSKVTITITFTCDGGSLCPSRGFADVPAGAWFHDAIDWAVENGVLNGYAGTNLMGPDDTMTRAQLAAMLYNIEGCPASSLSALDGVADADPTAWHAEPLAWALEVGIFEGYGDGSTVGPDDALTREQAAVVLMRWAQLKGEDTSQRADLSSFPDAGSVSDWAVDAMSWAVATETLNGIEQDDGTRELGPQETCTRAQLAALLMNHFDGEAL